MSTRIEDLVRDEVLSLHRFLERWLKGEIASAGAHPVRPRDALADEFFVIHPSGRRDGKAEMIRSFSSAYGEKNAGYALEVDLLDVRVPGERRGLAIYTESHRGEAGRARICTALLRQRIVDDTLEWLHLHETRIDDVPALDVAVQELSSDLG